MKLSFLIILLKLVIFIPGLSQESVEKLLEKGFDRYAEGDCEGAIKIYDLAIKTYKNNSEAYYLRGVCKSMLENNKEAIEDFDQAIKYNPKYAEAYFEKAYSYYVLDENRKALEIYNQAIDVDPEYAEAYMNRGSVKHNLNDTKGACEDWAHAEYLGMNLAYDLLVEFCFD
ncbi:hypothetical protein BH23BAC1_BH23BAC1_30350 [soil metagenome]